MVRTVSIAEVKNKLTSLVREVEGGAQIVITKDRRPAARIISEQEFQKMVRQMAVDELLRQREEWLAAGITGAELFEESRRQLEERP